MRYFLVFSVLILSVILTKETTDRIRLVETDEEVCESFHLQCGVTIRMTNYCGKNREVKCVCHVGESCSMNDLPCQ